MGLEHFQAGVRRAIKAINDAGTQDIEKVSWRGAKLALEKYTEQSQNFCKFMRTVFEEREQNPTFDNCMMNDYMGDISDGGDQKDFVNGFMEVIRNWK